MKEEKQDERASRKRKADGPASPECPVCAFEKKVLFVSLVFATFCPVCAFEKNCFCNFSASGLFDRDEASHQDLPMPQWSPCL